jgi:hypothetical protein
MPIDKTPPTKRREIETVFTVAYRVVALRVTVEFKRTVLAFACVIIGMLESL